MDEIYLLGYRAEYRVKKVYKYLVKESEIGIARKLLYDEKIPHAVTREKGATGLTLYTAGESKKLENGLGVRAGEDPLDGVSQGLINAILASAVRIRFTEIGWRRSSNKMFNPGLTRMSIPLEDPVVNVYEAVKFTVDSLIHGNTVLFIDPASKLEFTKSLAELESRYPSLVSKIKWVKLRDQTYSFYILDARSIRNESVSSRVDEDEYIREASEALRKCLDLEIGPLTSDRVIYATPRSLWLNNCLKAESRKLPLTNRGYSVVVPLPLEGVAPVGSLDNVSLFGRVGPLVRPPAERVKVVKKLAIETGIEEITYGELELSINLKNFVMVDAMDIHRPAQPIKSYIEVENGGLDNWRPRFKPGVNILFLLVKFRSDTKGKLRGSRFSRYDKLCGYVRRLLEEFIESWRLMGKVEVVEVNNDLGDLRDSLKDFIGGNEGHVFSVLLYVSDVDPYGDVIGRYEYEAILNKVYPHAIDLTDLLNGENRGDGLKTLRFKVINVIRDFAIRARALPHRLRPPQELGECVVVGIDATVKATRRGYLYPAAVVVLLKPDGTHEAYLQTVGVSDVDALVSALRETVRQITRRHEHVVAVINRASIKHILDRLISLDESFGELLNSYLLLSTFSKTHTYSRILRRYGDTFLNPTPRDIGLLVKLKQHEYRFNGVKITTSRFLSVTTSTPQSSGVEVGTVVPVVMSLTGGLDHTRAAEYLIALTNFARISYRSPSMPWPLRRADKLCKRVHRILDSIEDDSAIPMLQNYVMFL